MELTRNFVLELPLVYKTLGIRPDPLGPQEAVMVMPAQLDETVVRGIQASKKALGKDCHVGIPSNVIDALKRHSSLLLCASVSSALFPDSSVKQRGFQKSTRT